MSFIDKYYAIFNNSVGQHSVTIKRAEFANLLGVFSKQEQQFDQLKAENEEIKTKIKYMEEYIKTVENARNEVEQQLDKLKQTLTEIKEIAEPFCNACQEIEPENRKCMYCNYGKILQKISEVEDEN